MNSLLSQVPGDTKWKIIYSLIKKLYELIIGGGGVKINPSAPIALPYIKMII